MQDFALLIYVVQNVIIYQLLDEIKKASDKFIHADGIRIAIGFRVCPNSSCKLLFFIAYKTKMKDGKSSIELLLSIPQERLDFDATDIPKSIVNSLEEAITCHAHSCYVAGAIMVRKTLEELCKDKGAKGKNLYKQLEDLSNHVIVPQGLLKGVHNLRLLGNDAAHIELKNFDKIEEEEVRVGILFAKELLKSVYQSSQIADMLEALKK